MTVPDPLMQKSDTEIHNDQIVYPPDVVTLVTVYVQLVRQRGIETRYPNFISLNRIRYPTGIERQFRDSA